MRFIILTGFCGVLWNNDIRFAFLGSVLWLLWEKFAKEGALGFPVVSMRPVPDYYQ